MAAIIDTLEIAHELREAGVPETQAEAIARLFKRRYEADREELVTRAYLDFALERQAAELKAELARLEVGQTQLAAELKAELARLEAGQTQLAVELKAELARQTAELNAQIARMERDLILKLGGLITLVAGIIGALGALF